MASYMYTSKTANSWGDDDEDGFDFEPAVYARAAAEFGPKDKAKSTLSTARLALEELEKQSTAEDEQMQDCILSPSVTAKMSMDDYKKIDKEYWPSAAGDPTQNCYSIGKPAYPALSNDDGFVYPNDRRKYHKNWLGMKLWMGANMKCTAMMAPTPLHLSKTWVSDSLGEYVEERGYEYFPHLSLSTPRTSTPRSSHYNESGDERDEAQTPPDTPSPAKVSKCNVEIEEVSAIDSKIEM